MATLQKIRSHGALLLAVIGLALFAFIAEEAFRSCESQSNNNKQKIGSVMGESISAQEFQTMVDEFADVIKLSQGTSTLTDDELNQVKDQVWQNYVSSKILAKECDKLGIQVTDDELRQTIKDGASPLLMQTPFRNAQTGAFDYQQLQQFLTEYEKMDRSNAQMVEYYERIHSYWMYIEKTLRQQLAQQKYQTLLQKSFISNPVSAKSSFEGRTDSKDIILAAIPYASIADSTVAVTDADIKKIYNEKKEMFYQPAETRNIKYIDVKITASDKDKEDLLAEMTEYSSELDTVANPANVIRTSASTIAYNDIAVSKAALPTDVASEMDSISVGETVKPYYTASDNTYTTFKYIEKVNVPDSIEVRQLQVNPEKADSIFTAMKDGASFDDVAKKYGQTSQPIWLTGAQYERAQLDAQSAEFINAIVNAPVNEIRKIDAMQATIIYQVTDRKAFTDKYKVAIIKRDVVFSQETSKKAFNDFSTFVASNTTLADIEKNAEEKGYKLYDRNDLYNSEHNVCGVSKTSEVMKWIFSAKKGEVSPLFECGEDADHMMLVALTDINPEGYRSFESVKNDIRPEAIREKKAEILLPKIANAKSIDDVMKVEDAKSDTIKSITFSAPAFVSLTVSSEPALSGKVAATANGKFATGVKGNGGVFAFQVINEEKNEEKFDEKAEMSRLAMEAQQSASAYSYDLYLKAKVVDNRYKFF